MWTIFVCNCISSEIECFVRVPPSRLPELISVARTSNPLSIGNAHCCLVLRHKVPLRLFRFQVENSNSYFRRANRLTFEDASPFGDISRQRRSNDCHYSDHSHGLWPRPESTNRHSQNQHCESCFAQTTTHSQRGHGATVRHARFTEGAYQSLCGPLGGDDGE